MGTAQLLFAEVLWGATGSHVAGSDVSHVPGSMFCAYATVSCAISAIVGLFDRKWQSHVTGRDPVRKRPCPEVCYSHARLFSAFFSLEVVTWLPDVTKGHLTHSGFHWVCARSDRRSRDPFGSVLGVFSTTSASYNHRKPRILYLAWWLELALVISPFYFHIVSI